jgi:hypothetical protein
MLKLCKVLMFGVVLVITSGLKTPLHAADSAPTDTAAVSPNSAPTTPPTSTPGPLAYDGKIVVVDRAAKTVTIEIQKRLYLFKLGANATIVRNGKKAVIDDLSAGQQVN